MKDKSASQDSCAFCAIVAGVAPADVVDEGAGFLAFKPHQPHTPGHVLFIPKEHLRDASENPEAGAEAFVAAAEYVRRNKLQANIITSVGPAATQTVWHLHVHVVPRGPEDGIRRAWPWRIRLSEGLKPGDIFPEK